MSPEEKIEEAIRVIGELVVFATALDLQLNKLLIVVLYLEDSTMLDSVVASLDAVRKIEILKSWASKIKAEAWKTNLAKYLKAVEQINRKRNIAAHSMPGIVDGKLVLSSSSAAKLLNSINIDSKTRNLPNIGDLKKMVEKADGTLKNGEILIRNFKQISTKVKLELSKMDT